MLCVSPSTVLRITTKIEPIKINNEETHLKTSKNVPLNYYELAFKPHHTDFDMLCELRAISHGQGECIDYS